MEYQRKWVSVVKSAIEQFVSEHNNSGEHDYEVDGHTVLITRNAETRETYKVGIYLPGSNPAGECDFYTTCSADGEEA